MAGRDGGHDDDGRDGVGDLLSEEPGDRGRDGDDRDPYGDPPHVIVLLHGGGVQAFRRNCHLRAGAGLGELDDAMQELALPVGNAGDLVEPVGDVRNQGSLAVREMPNEFGHLVVGGGGVQAMARIASNAYQVLNSSSRNGSGSAPTRPSMICRSEFPDCLARSATRSISRRVNEDTTVDENSISDRGCR